MCVLKNYFCLFFVLFAMASQIQANNDLSSGLSNFAKDFFWECAQSKPGNVIVSPLSVSIALAMLSQGANGNTFEELHKGLHLNADKTAVAGQFLEHYELLKNNAGNSTFSIANRIYVKEGYRLKKSFQDVATTSFKSGVESVNFAEKEQSANIINQFVKDETNGKIKEMIKPDMLNPDTRTVLVNAIYFKGNWAQKFPIERTQVDDFYISETETVPVEFMSTSNNFNHAYMPDLEATALEMKYADSDFSFVIVLPRERTGLPALEAKLKDYNFDRIIDHMRSRKIMVKVPKFKIEFDINLNEVLKKMGMGEMFEDNANLSGLLDSGEPLHVSDVIHKAFIEVNEEGSEAGGATAIVVQLTRMSPPSFRADHPFVYFIRATDKNTILFSGRIEKF